VVWAQGVTRASKEKKLPGFSQLESTSSDFDGQGQGGWWILAGQKGVGHPAVSRQLDASKARCPTGATTACPDTCKCG